MRDIDDLIEYIRSRPYLSPTEKQVLITRVEQKPTLKEITDARGLLYGDV